MSNFAQEQAVLAQAGLAVSNALGLKAGDVVISSGVSPNNDIWEAEHQKKNTNLVITIKGIGIDLDQVTAEKKVLEALEQFPDIKKFVQLKSNETLASDVRDKLKIATQGTDFDKHILAWSPFAKPEILESDWAVTDHAIIPRADAYGVTFGINVPVDKNNPDPKELSEKVDKNIKERLPEIQEELTKCTIKYITKNLQADGKSEAEIAQAIEKVKADMEKLHISANLDNNGSNIEIAIRSPEQEDAFKNKTGDSWQVPDNADILKASNPLNELTQTVTADESKTNPNAGSQFDKAIGRAFLYGGGEKAMEVFPLIAGKRDILNAIKKEATKFPEKAALFDDILASDLFKKHGYGVGKDEAGAAPAKPIFMKHYDKPDTLELWIKTEKDKVPEIASALVGDGKQIPATSAISPENFKKQEGNWLQNLLGLTSNSQQPQQLAYR